MFWTSKKEDGDRNSRPSSPTLLPCGEVVQFLSLAPVMLAKSDLRVTWYSAQNVRSFNSISHTEVAMSLTEVESIKKEVQAVSDAFHSSAMASDRCQTASR
jgi:hypothetical protein